MNAFTAPVPLKSRYTLTSAPGTAIATPGLGLAARKGNSNQAEYAKSFLKGLFGRGWVSSKGIIRPCVHSAMRCYLGRKLAVAGFLEMRRGAGTDANRSCSWEYRLTAKGHAAALELLAREQERAL